MEGTIGEVRLFGGNFAPRAWNMCDGTLLSIAVYTALYSVIGTTYGGDGQTTFAVPDLRSRVAIGTGQGQGLSNYTLGEVAGSESVTILTSQIPSHTHVGTLSFPLQAVSAAGTTGDPNGSYLAGLNGAYSSEATDSNLKPFNLAATLNPAGGSQPVSIMQPYTALNYIICLEGVFPSRN